MIDLLIRIRRYAVPVALEVSTIESITPGFDYYFIPSVLNSTETKWVKDLHHAATKEFGEVMNWDEMIPEGYCILNPDCKAAKLTNAKQPEVKKILLRMRKWWNIFLSFRFSTWNIAGCMEM